MATKANPIGDVCGSHALDLLMTHMRGEKLTDEEFRYLTQEGYLDAAGLLTAFGITSLEAWARQAMKKTHETSGLKTYSADGNSRTTAIQTCRRSVPSAALSAFGVETDS